MTKKWLGVAFDIMSATLCRIERRRPVSIVLPGAAICQKSSGNGRGTTCDWRDGEPVSVCRRGATAYPAIQELFTTAEERQREFLTNIKKYAEDIEKIGENNPPEPRWDQDWFPRMDAVAAYVMVRERQPRRIIEVGSGHSTRFLARAVRDGALPTRITAVDPGPRAMIDGLDVETVPELVHEVPPELFAELGAGDILFIDSSHILMPGTDVDYLLNSVLPRLPSGVLIHIHDIPLPDPYPEAWTWRGYNEQLGVALLLQGGAYEILFSSRYAVTRLQKSFEETPAAGVSLNEGALETSLWLRKL